MAIKSVGKNGLVADNRTLQQNKALHKFFEILSASLNDSGYDMKRTLKEQVEIPWTASTIKEYLWRPVQDAMLQKESTTELTTKEINEVYEVLARHLGDKLGVVIPAFPSIEDVIRKEIK